MGSDLYNRLKHLKKNRPGGSSPAPDSSVAPGPSPPPRPAAGVSTGEAAGPMDVSPPPGWEAAATGVWRRRVETASEAAGRLYALISEGNPALVPRGTAPEELVFFDAETTGLSAGAGTVAFLVGFGRITPGSIETEQLFMADYPAETDYLTRMSALIREGDVAVSYNGKGFDTHVLRTRFLLNGMRTDFGAQLDLLYPARRLWRRQLGECSLGRVEEGVLGIRRGRDLPGAEVPERYFSFLRSVESGVLEDVFAHHLQDIESLVSLLARIEGVFADPSESAARSEDVDRFQLGRMLLDQGRSEGAEVLDTVIRSEPSARETIRAAHVLARHYRYAGRIEAAADVWDRVYRRHGSVAAGIERAKYLEHRLRDFRGAEELVLKLIARPHSLPFRSDLEKRLERVRRRASRR